MADGYRCIHCGHQEASHKARDGVDLEDFENPLPGKKVALRDCPTYCPPPEEDRTGRGLQY